MEEYQEHDERGPVGSDGHEVPEKLKIEQGSHHDILDTALLPYTLQKNLGFGASASVEMVEDTITGSLYARKIYRNVTTRNLQEVKQRYLNEVQIMRRLATHRHVIRVFATYTAGRELALVLQPVADSGDLAAFLASCRDSGDLDPSRRRILRSCFGCLSDGLSFMHQQTIRHKDIKPQNILIHQGSPIFTDFGLSYDSSLAGHSMTGGRPAMFTRKYCSPEVADWENRNSKSDVFSLGCVFLEIFSGLYDKSMPEILSVPYHKSIDKLRSYLAPFDRGPLRLRAIMAPTISRMLDQNPEVRPSADLVAQVLQESEFSDFAFCVKCEENFHQRNARRSVATNTQQRSQPDNNLVTLSTEKKTIPARSPNTAVRSPTTKAQLSGYVLTKRASMGSLKSSWKHVNVAPLRADMRSKVQSRRPYLVEDYNNLPSDNQRAQINNLLDNQIKMWPLDGGLEWAIAGIKVDWKNISGTQKQTTAIHVLLVSQSVPKVHSPTATKPTRNQTHPPSERSFYF